MRTYIISCMLLIGSALHAQVCGRVTNKSGEALQGVTVLWLNTQTAAETNAEGHFSLPATPSSRKLVVRSVGYKTDTVEAGNSHMEIELTDNLQLGEVTVVARDKGTFKLKSSLLNTEKITSAELCKAACCNLSESFATNPSVDVTYSDAATGAKQIKLLGLPGSYVQMLTENIPNFRGISAPYGMDYIPGSWMESIQVSKGTASVVNGYEAITGQINVEYKKPPTAEKLAVNLFSSDAGRFEANLTSAVRINPHLSGSVLMHASNESMLMDDNGDNFADFPATRQYNLINRWYYKKANFVSQLFVRALSEERQGGQINGAYKIDINSKRGEAFLKNSYVFDPNTGTSLALIFSGSAHKQLSEYGTKRYDGEQNSVFSNLVFQSTLAGKHTFTSGINLNYDHYYEWMPSVQAPAFVRNETVAGVYTEYSYKPTANLMFMGGVRYDHNSLYGSLFTPRFHVKYALSDHLALRGTVGKGFRSPQILSEYNYFLAGNRSIVIASPPRMEEAWNYGISATYDLDLAGKEIMINGEWYYTNFLHQTIADMDSRPHQVIFDQMNGKSFSHSAQVEVSSEIVTGLTLNLAHRINIVKQTIGGVLRDKPLTSRLKSLLGLSYQTPRKQWQFDYTAQLNGGGRMPDPDVQTPLWKRDFAPFTIMNAQVTKYFKKWSLYAGSENLTNFVQKNPIVEASDPDSPDFDASMVWGPIHGRKFYVGLRFAL